MKDAQPEWFKEAYRIGKIKPIHGTPTFIIWNGSKEGGAEIARLVGYRDKGRFYSRLKEMLSIEDRWNHRWMDNNASVN